MKVSSEDILFILPDSREYLFPAMSALQSYVNSYELKMRSNSVLSPMPKYIFRYAVELPQGEWEFFARLGIVLNQQPESIGHPDAVIDLRRARIDAFRVPGQMKHAAQICSAIAGVEARPFPQVKVRVPDFEMKNVWTPDTRPVTIGGAHMVSEDDLLNAEDGVIGCLLAYQGWETYMMCAQGLPVIEVLEEGKSEVWLSKWSNPYYRAIEERALPHLLNSTLDNLREVLQWQYKRAQAEGTGETQTGVLKYSAMPAVNISGLAQ